MRDARAHQATTQYANLFNLNRRDACGAASALFSSLFVDEQGADHILRLAARKQFGEIFGFNTQRRVEREDGTFIQTRQNGLNGVKIAFAFLMRHRVQANE